jgi:hypothetical protein
MLLDLGCESPRGFKEVQVHGSSPGLIRLLLSDTLYSFGLLGAAQHKVLSH